MKLRRAPTTEIIFIDYIIWKLLKIGNSASIFQAKVVCIVAENDGIIDGFFSFSCAALSSLKGAAISSIEGVALSSIKPACRQGRGVVAVFLNLLLENRGCVEFISMYSWKVWKEKPCLIKACSKFGIVLLWNPFYISPILIQFFNVFPVDNFNSIWAFLIRFSCVYNLSSFNSG